MGGTLFGRQSSHAPTKVHSGKIKTSEAGTTLYLFSALIEVMTHYCEFLKEEKIPTQCQKGRKSVKEESATDRLPHQISTGNQVQHGRPQIFMLSQKLQM